MPIATDDHARYIFVILFKVKSAHRQSLITHSNGLAILGAVVQATAVWSSLRAEQKINSKDFIEQLVQVVAKTDGVFDDQREYVSYLFVCFFCN